MATKKTIDSTLFEADRLIQVWTDNPTFSMGDVTLVAFKAEVAKLRDLKTTRDETRVKLTKLIDDTNDQRDLVDGIVTRGRSGMKASFGPNSAQYEQVGGKRLSDRKPPKRKSPKTPTTPPTS